MKTKFALIAGLALTTMLLSGCNEQSAPTSGNAAVPISPFDNQAQSQNLGLTVAPAANSSTSAQSTGVTILPSTQQGSYVSSSSTQAQPLSSDLQFLSGAKQLNDVSYCTKILDNNLRLECQTTIQTALITQKALSASDAKVCNQLSGNQIDLCKMKVEIAVKQNDAMREPTTQESQIMQEAQFKKDKTICNQIKSQYKRDNCLINVDHA
jgi:hypothetical protein